MRKKPQETGREHGKEIGKHKPIGTAKGRYGMGCDAEKVIKIHDQENWTKQDHGLWTLTILHALRRVRLHCPKTVV